MDLKTVQTILDMRSKTIETLIKTHCQDLVIQQLKRDKDRLESENKLLSKKVEKLETTLGSKQELEVKLTSERDVLKESLKRTQFDLEKANKKVDLEHTKRQKFRKSYGILSKSLQTDNTEINNALEELKEGLMN